MAKRFVSIWFRHLPTDWCSLRRPALRDKPLVLAAPDHGRMVITAANAPAQAQGIDVGMAVADARALAPSLEVMDDTPGRNEKLLKALAEWCIRFTPVAAVDMPDGLLLDVSGCAHLWGGERPYLKEIITRLKSGGYDVRAAMADTAGTAWAIARFGKVSPIIESGGQLEALLSLSPVALRIEPLVWERLQKLGLTRIHHLVNLPRKALLRRFGAGLLLRIDQAMGAEEETLQPVQPAEPWQERLPCPEPVATAAGIEIALQRLLEALCARLRQEGKGLRTAVLKCYRVDGQLVSVAIGTNRASHHTPHLFRLFELNIPRIEPALGIELFVLEAPTVEAAAPLQEKMWEGTGGLDSPALAELLDRIGGRVGAGSIHRYLPDEHYWPERSYKLSAGLQETPATGWRSDRPRPICLLPVPEPVEVAAPIPDYPPMNFRHRGVLHTIKKADGPERIEREWWIEEGDHRDYYCVEDEAGRRYWLFRSGHYDGETRGRWFLHGYFA